MAKSNLEVIYFNGKGRIETARIMLNASGTEFKDTRYEENEWPKHKHTAPFGQLPLLKVDGKPFAQSIAIKTFLARELGFYGQTNLECFEIDQIVQLVEDFTNTAVKALFVSEDEAVVKEAVAKVRANEGVRYLGYFEKMLQENGPDYFVGNRLTLADLSVFDLVNGMCENALDVNDNFPLVKKLVQTLNAHSKIGPYIASRGPTAF